MSLPEQEMVIVLDFVDSTAIHCRRIRELKVFCEMIPYSTPVEEIKAKRPGIIFSGGPSSVFRRSAGLRPSTL